MFLSISKYLVEFFRGNPADFQFWLYHIESVYIRVVNIHFGRDARVLQIFNVTKRFHIKRLPVSNESIGRRQISKVLRPCRGGIGGHLRL